MTVAVIYGMLYSVPLFAQNKVFVAEPLFNTMTEGDKGAILMVHFGTTHDDTRLLTLDAINDSVKKAFPNFEVREAYTSRIIIKRLRDNKAIVKYNPTEALQHLHKDGYTHILVVPTSITDGVEMTSINREVAHSGVPFKKIRVTTPLLFHESDYDKMIGLLTTDCQPDMATLWVGHGTYDVATAQYAMLDHMLQLNGLPNVIVGCIEGYPYLEQALQRLQATGLKKVRLKPFMIVAGEHAKEDIADDWANRLQEEGYNVEVDIEGLGSHPEIQKIIIDKIHFYLNRRRLLIGEKKKIYEITGEKMHADE